MAKSSQGFTKTQLRDFEIDDLREINARLLEALKEAHAYLAALPTFPDRGFDVPLITRRAKAAIRAAEGETK